MTDKSESGWHPKVNRREGMREVEFRLITELLRDSRRSDKQLAEALGVSQPTVTRARQRLEKAGYIQQYTIIPQNPKIGYEIMSLTFYKLRQGISQEEFREMRKAAMKLQKQRGNATLMIVNGVGLGYDIVALNLHENYSAYTKYVEDIKERSSAKSPPFLDVSRIDSFIINLGDKDNYQSLTFSKIANHLSRMKQKWTILQIDSFPY